jgi:hypothetical protein
MGTGVAVGGMGVGIGVGSGVAAGAQAYSSIVSNTNAPTTLNQSFLGGPVLWFDLFMCILLLLLQYEVQR